MPYKYVRVQLSFSEDTLELLDEIQKEMKAVSRSEVVRRLVMEKYERVKQNNIGSKGR